MTLFWGATVLCSPKKSHDCIPDFIYFLEVLKFGQNATDIVAILDYLEVEFGNNWGG
jgi:hypothetical protein